MDRLRSPAGPEWKGDSMATMVGVEARQLRRVAVASAIGSTIEWYDFFIFSTAVPLVLNTQFSTLSTAAA